MKSGYEISFDDFCRLLSDDFDRQAVAPLLREWFGYEVEVAGAGFILRNPRGETVEPREVHDAIQADSERQGRIYRAAMTLWR